MGITGASCTNGFPHCVSEIKATTGFIHCYCTHRLNPQTCARCNRTDLAVSPEGGVQSKLDARPSLLPPKALQLVSIILGIKAREYGEWNWKKINNEDNFDHVLNHALEHVKGDRSEFHLANLVCRALFYLEGAIEKGHGYDLTYLGIKAGDFGSPRILGEAGSPRTDVVLDRGRGDGDDPRDVGLVDKTTTLTDHEE